MAKQSQQSQQTQTNYGNNGKQHEIDEQWHIEMPRKISVEVEIEIFGTESHADKVAHKLRKMLQLNIPNSRVVAWDVEKNLKENSV